MFRMPRCGARPKRLKSNHVITMCASDRLAVRLPITCHSEVKWREPGNKGRSVDLRRLEGERDAYPFVHADGVFAKLGSLFLSSVPAPLSQMDPLLFG
jgi:hypothetical protein